MANNTLRLPRRRASLDARRARSGYLFTLPFIIGIIFVYIPILIDAVLLSFYNFEASEATPGQMEYVFKGMDFYAKAFENPDFVEALLGGFQQLLLEVPTIVIFSLFIAVVLNQKMLGRAAFRAIFFVPVIISTGLMETISASDVVTDMMEGGIDQGTGAEGGILQVEDLQEMFQGMGFGTDVVNMVVSLVNDIYRIINYSGVQMLIFLAALQGISPAIYEASTIDGATGWETFWKITFPMISPMILVNAAYTIIDAFTRTSNVSMSYITSIGDVGVAAAMSWIYFVIVILVIGLVAAIISSFVFYQRRD